MSNGKNGKQFSVISIIGDSFKLLMQSLLYLFVVGGGNIIGLIIMIFINGYGIPKNVSRTIITILTIPASLLIIILSPLAFIQSIGELFHNLLQKMLSVYFPFSKFST